MQIFWKILPKKVIKICENEKNYIITMFEIQK